MDPFDDIDRQSAAVLVAALITQSPSGDFIKDCIAFAT